MSFSLENLQERSAADNGAARSGRGSVFDEGTNWWPLVRSAFLAALTAFLIKLASLGWMAQQNDVSLEVRFWKGIVPHLGMQLPPAQFAHIVTWSTFIMAVGATVAFAVAVLSSKLPKMVVWGWFMGVFVTIETLVLELLRHLLEPPVVETGTVWRTAIPIAAGVGLAAAYGLITREKREKVPQVPVARAVFTSPEGAMTVDTRPGATTAAPPVAMPTPPTPAPEPPPAAPDRVPAYTAAPAMAAPVAPANGNGNGHGGDHPAETRPATAAALAEAAEPNRIVDARPAAAQDGEATPPSETPVPVVDARPAAARDTTPKSQPDAPAPIVDARPAALRGDESDAEAHAEPSQPSA
jgi:hypothetical protein